MNNQSIVNWISQLQAIAQNGLTFAKDPFDIERYQQLNSIAAEMASQLTEMPAEKILHLFDQEVGYLTPKIDVRGVVFQDSKILMVKETSDQCWSLPGGWVDVNESPSFAIEREIKEESGFDAKAIKLLALYDRLKHDHPYQLPHAYKCFIHCELMGGKAATSIETAEIDFFALDNLPKLSEGRVTKKQIARMFEHKKNPAWPTDFD